VERWSWAQAIAAPRAAWWARTEAVVPTLLAVASRLATSWAQQHLLANTAATKQSTRKVWVVLICKFWCATLMI
jgi:hypothetical protein